MPRYIDAEKLLKDWTTEDDFQNPDERWRPESEFAAIVNIQPTADVRIDIHAHWVDEEGSTVCSHCGHSTDDLLIEFDGTAIVSRVPYFCGKCGARMDEEEE